MLLPMKQNGQNVLSLARLYGQFGDNWKKSKLFLQRLTGGPHCDLHLSFLVCPEHPGVYKKCICLLSTYLSTYRRIDLFTNQPTHPPTYRPTCLTTYLSMYLFSIHLFIDLFIYLSVYLSMYLFNIYLFIYSSIFLFIYWLMYRSIWLSRV